MVNDSFKRTFSGGACPTKTFHVCAPSVTVVVVPSEIVLKTIEDVYTTNSKLAQQKYYIPAAQQTFCRNDW